MFVRNVVHPTSIKNLNIGNFTCIANNSRTNSVGGVLEFGAIII